MTTSPMTWQIALVSVAVLANIAVAHEDQPTVVVPATWQRDAGLSLAIDDLCDALGSASAIYRAKNEPLPSADLVLLEEQPQTEAEPLPLEGFHIKSVGPPGSNTVCVRGDVRGRMYGVFKLAERVRLGGQLNRMNLRMNPAFPLRMFSEQGQLLDLPDRNYYSDQYPYVNAERLRRDVTEAKKLIDHVVRLGFNTITFLHVNCEDYIDYNYLDSPIYPKEARHLARSPVFCEYLTELCDYAHERHLEVFLQLYETQYPPEVNRRYEVRLDSPNIQTIISAKCRELFERVPLDGLVITPTESHPRCGYESTHLWAGQGLAGAGKMLTLYHNACQALGKQAVFRLWRIATNAKGVREACDRVPPGAMLCVKNTGGDFYLNSPLTDIVTKGIGHEQPLMVVFDTFRQYDGWSQCFCLMQQWPERVKACCENGVTAINAWGAWSPGCIWPDWEPGYLKNPSDKPVGWAGYWNRYRMFTGGFSPGQANAYLLSRLCWDPEAKARDVVRDFCALHLGPQNADAAADALLQTELAWHEHYGNRPGRISHPVYIKWTMVFGPRIERMTDSYPRFGLEEMLASNSRGLDAVAKMEAAFARTARAKAPRPEVYDKFQEGIDKTALMLRSLHYFREFWWRGMADRELEGQAQQVNAAARQAVRKRLLQLLDDWRRFGDDAAFWRITYRYSGEPKIYARRVFPYWWPTDLETTLEQMVNDPGDGRLPE